MAEPAVNPSMLLSSPVMREVKSKVVEAVEAEVEEGEVEEEGLTEGEREKSLLRRQFGESDSREVGRGHRSCPSRLVLQPRRTHLYHSE